MEAHINVPVGERFHPAPRGFKPLCLMPPGLVVTMTKDVNEYPAARVAEANSARVQSTSANGR